MIGTVLDGRYRILEKLGEGGMGEVYLAEHTNLGRKEALKILQADLAAEREFVSRFRREARATNRVQHPNIVGVYDFGQLPDGRFYLTMEYAAGERLDALLRRLGRLPVPRALGILLQLCDAVHHAHEQGVVHRDLKPDNLILTEQRGRADVLKVLDFGIAKIVTPDHAESQMLTRKGQLFGTPLYMAPEQAAGVGTDPRSDIYAIGCIAFELLVGEPPFRGRLVELIMAHKTKAPDLPSARRPEAAIPPELDSIVRRCLEKEPVRRFQTAAEVLAALSQVPGCPGRKTPADTRRRPTLVGRPADYAAVLETEPDGPRHLWAAMRAGEPAPAPVPTREVGETEAERRAALRELAETLLSLRASDVRLIVAVANLHDAEERLAGDEVELEALVARMGEVDHAARKREAALRSALSDLRFAVADAKGNEETLDGSVGAQVRGLEERLARLSAEHERAIRELTDKAVTVTANRVSAEEQLEVIYGALGDQVEWLVPQFWSHPEVVMLARRLDAAGDGLENDPTERS